MSVILCEQPSDRKRSETSPRPSVAICLSRSLRRRSELGDGFWPFASANVFGISWAPSPRWGDTAASPHSPIRRLSRRGISRLGRKRLHLPARAFCTGARGCLADQATEWKGTFPSRAKLTPPPLPWRLCAGARDCLWIASGARLRGQRWRLRKRCVLG